MLADNEFDNATKNPIYKAATFLLASNQLNVAEFLKRVQGCNVLRSFDMYRNKAQRESNDSESESALLEDENGFFVENIGNSKPYDHEIKNKLIGEMWQDVFTEEGLSQTLSKVGVKVNEDMTINRGVESYSIPGSTDSNSSDGSYKSKISSSTISRSDFSACVNEENRNSQSDGNRYKNMKKQKNLDRLASSWIRNTNQSKSRINKRRRGKEVRGRNFDEMLNSFVNFCQKRKQGRRNKYSSEAFVAANNVKKPKIPVLLDEISEELELPQLAEEMARILGERDTCDVVNKAIVAVGKDAAIRLFNQTKNVEKAGGLLVADGSRRRTPGGVFMFLLKVDPEISHSVKQAIRAYKAVGSKKRRNKGSMTKIANIIEDKLNECNTDVPMEMET